MEREMMQHVSGTGDGFVRSVEIGKNEKKTTLFFSGFLFLVSVLAT